MRRFSVYDSPQEAFSFLLSQTTYIEADVYRIQYPDIIYPTLVPVDSSANEWAKSVTYFSMDRVGEAEWFDGYANDMRMADITRNKFEATMEMAGIGYRYTLEEIGQAMMVPGLNLTSERAAAAVRAYQEFMDRFVRVGDSRKGTTGLINDATVSRSDAIADGTSSSPNWSAKTADQIIRDVNNTLTGIYTGSLTVELADTLLLPIEAWQLLSNTRIPNTMESAMAYLQNHNLYTMTTGAPLMIRGIIGLDTAGSGGVGRMVAYRRDPSILKIHVPMPHRFLPVFQRGPMTFDIPGIFRTGPVEIRRPKSFAYLDGITPVPS